MDRPERRIFNDDEIRGIILEEEGDAEVLPSDDEESEELADLEDDNDREYEPSSESGSDSEDQEDNRWPAERIEELEEELTTRIQLVENPQPTENQESQIPGPSKKKRGRPAKRRRVDASNGDGVNSKQSSNDLLTLVESDGDSILGKDKKYVWKNSPITTRGKVPQKNVVHFMPGPQGAARLVPRKEDCFEIFFTPGIMETIIKHTNEEIQRQRGKYLKPQTFINDLYLPELKALLGILILSAALKDNHLTARMMFDVTLCGESYRAAMSRPRFEFLINCLRFDDRLTRDERLKINKLALFSEVWDPFVSNCKSSYNPSPYVTIDEQLVGFRGRCSFKVYMPSKPNKYGLKIMMACDNGTHYMYNAEVYTGKTSIPEKKSYGEYITTKLVEPLYGSNRNLTCDNWFTSIPLARTLMENGITMVGTVKKNKRELPVEFVDPKYKKRGEGSSMFLFSEDITAVSYKPNKKNKLVSLISTMHNDDSINDQTGKPEIIMTYNSTKGAVDTLDQLCQNRNTNRKTKRWPLCLFYNMINIAIHDSYVIYCHNYFKNNIDETGPMPNKSQFVVDLAKGMMSLWMHMRLTHPVPRALRSMIHHCLGMEERLHPDLESTSGNLAADRGTCSICPWKKKRRTKSLCQNCKAYMCGEHKRNLCINCFDRVNIQSQS